MEFLDNKKYFIDSLNILLIVSRKGINYENQIYYSRFSIATVNLFGDQSSPYRCRMSGNELEADIIVMGGGAAGCILMNQLSENGHFSVLGIEGGQNLTNDPAIEAVGLPAFLLAGTGKPTVFLARMESNRANARAQWTNK